MTSIDESFTYLDIEPEVHPVVQRSQEINRRTVELCSTGDLIALMSHIDSNPGYIRIGSNGHAAWKAAVKEHNLKIIKYLARNYAQELGNQCDQSLTEACESRDLMTAAMLLDPSFKYISYQILFILQVAGENGDEGLVDYIVSKRADQFSNRYTMIAAAICGALRSGNLEVLASLLGKLAIGNDQATNKKLYRGMLVRAAQIGDPETFLKVLETCDCKFMHEPNSNSSYIAFNHVFAAINKTGALFTITDLCCSNPSSLLIDALINTFGSQMCISDKHMVCLEKACRRGHVDAIKFFIKKFVFSDISGLITIARTYRQAAVLALFFFRYGKEVVFSAEPEHIDSIKQLLSEHFRELSGQFASGL